MRGVFGGKGEGERAMGGEGEGFGGFGGDCLGGWQ